MRFVTDVNSDLSSAYSLPDGKVLLLSRNDYQYLCSL